MKCFLYFSLLTIAFASCTKSGSDPGPSITITSISPTQAEEGQTVSIKGMGFTQNTTVAFNGTAAKTTTFTSASAISAVVPDGVTTGKITLTEGSATFTSPADFTVIVPLSAKSTVTKLADIPAFPTSGADGVRMAYSGNALYITGPGQKTVYKMDLTTLGVAPFQTITASPVGIAQSGDQILFNDTGVSGASNGYFYSYRFNLLSRSATTSPVVAFSLKAFPNTPQRYVLTSFTNELWSLNSTTLGGNTSSTIASALLNSQLKGTPDEANAHLATNSKSIFVFCNQALWKLQADNTLKLVAGAAGQKGYVDGVGAAARFRDGGYARGNAIAVDESDNVYVADYGSGCIRRVDASGNVTTVAGNNKLAGSGAAKEGKGNKMIFSFDSFDLALAPDGTLYAIAVTNTPTSTLRNAVYKVVFDK